DRARALLLATTVVLGGLAMLGAGAMAAGGSAGSAVASPAPSVSSSPTAEPFSPGRALYFVNCAMCHGNRGEGTARGPSLIGVGAASPDFMLSTGRMPIPDVPNPELEPQRHPPYFTPAQIRELDAYIAALGPGPGIPSVNPAAGSLS